MSVKNHIVILMATVASLSIVTNSVAQTISSRPVDDGAAAEDASMADIVVTGSRLQSGYMAPTPMTVLGAQTIQQRAPSQISDVMNQLPAVRLSTGPQQSQRFFGSGQAPIDLRGLGAVRTLTLVNGNRFTPTAETGTVDSSIIPVSLIERVDVVTGGASAAYGSDAVAGVVNFVLLNRLEGFRGSAQIGVTQQGDGNERVLSLAFGTSLGGGRGHLIIGGDYSRSDGVDSIYTRDWGRRESYLVSNGVGRAAGVPAQSFETNVKYSAQSTGGLINSGPLAGTAFGPGGVPYAFQYGTVLGSLMIGGENDRGNPNGNARLLTPTSRKSLLIRADYEILSDVTAFFEGNYGFTDADSLTGFYQGSAIIDIDNPFLPDQTRAAMVDAGVTTVNVGRLLADYGGTPLYANHRTLRGIGGLRGTLPGNFNWDASVQYGETKNVNRNDDVLVANFKAAVNAVTGPDDRPACGPIATNPNLTAAQRELVEPGCVPLDIFGLYSPSKEALNYVRSGGPSVSVNRPTRFVAAVNIAGSPFSTWAAPVDVALGGEYRRDTIKSESNPNALKAAYNVANDGAYSGSVSVKEGYLEVGVPLARDVTALQSLDLNAAIRVTDYSTSGSVTTWKVGGTWEPVAGLKFRATRSRDIRAPNLSELYRYFGVAGSANVTNPFNGVNGRLSVAQTGNPSLTPEIADTLTAGVVVQPQAEWARFFRASVDYYEIKIKDAIVTVSSTDVLRRCFAGETALCSAIVFDDTPFGIAYVNQQPFNQNRLLNRGLEMTANMDFSLADDTRFSIAARALRALANRTYDRGTIIERAGSIQSGGIPKWAATVDLTLDSGNLQTTLTGRYFSTMKFDATLKGPEDEGYDPTLANSVNTNRAPSAVYLDLYAQYQIPSEGRTKFSLFGMIQNLADKDPWVHAATNITSGGNPYDLLGRRFRIGVRVTH